MRTMLFMIATLMGLALLSGCGSSEITPEALDEQGTPVGAAETGTTAQVGAEGDADAGDPSMGPRIVPLLAVDPAVPSYLRTLTGFSREKLPDLSDAELDCLASNLNDEGLGTWLHSDSDGDDLTLPAADFAGADAALQDAVGLWAHRCLEPANADAMLANASIDVGCFREAVTERDMISRVFSVLLVVDPEADRFDDEAWDERFARCLDTERLIEGVVAQGVSASDADCYIDRLFAGGEITHEVFHRHRAGIEGLNDSVPEAYRAAELECLGGRTVLEIGSSQ